MAQVAPGTTSTILWHFPGGPAWNHDENRQYEEPKPENDANDTFCKILESKELRVGSYREVVKAILPTRHRWDRATGRRVEEHDVHVELESVPVCCLAEIPIQHLPYHRPRYGRFAIGFRRERAVKHGFNSVLYTLETTPIVTSLYAAIQEANSASPEDIENLADDVSSIVETATSEHDDLDLDVSSEVNDIRFHAMFAQDAIDSAVSAIEKLMAFTKTFTPDEFTTIYCEREWRAVETFAFSWDDIAMLVLPRDGDENYFEQFTQKAEAHGIPRTVPIVPWEDLVEH